MKVFTREERGRGSIEPARSLQLTDLSPELSAPRSRAAQSLERILLCGASMGAVVAPPYFSFGSAELASCADIVLPRRFPSLEEPRLQATGFPAPPRALLLVQQICYAGASADD
jgi:hypothetical protein